MNLQPVIECLVFVGLLCAIAVELTNATNLLLIHDYDSYVS